MRIFHGDALGVHDVDDGYYDNDNEEFGVKKFHGGAVGLDKVDDDCMIVMVVYLNPKLDDTVEADVDYDYCDDNYQEFNGIRIHNVNKIYKKLRDHYYYTRKYRKTAHSICNLRYKSQKKFLQSFIMKDTMIRFSFYVHTTSG